MEDKEVGIKTIIGGKFNAKTGRESDEMQRIEEKNRE